MCRLAEAIRQTLEKAIRAGGTTLRDFQNVDGLPAIFSRLSTFMGARTNRAGLQHADPPPSSSASARVLLPAVPALGLKVTQK